MLCYGDHFMIDEQKIARGASGKNDRYKYKDLVKPMMMIVFCY